MPIIIMTFIWLKIERKLVKNWFKIEILRENCLLDCK